jgi:hypothetical protein
MEADLTTISIIVGLATTVATILGKVVDKWIGGFWGFMGKENIKSEKDNKQEIEIAVLQTQMQTILTNHIPHIEKSLEVNNLEHKETQKMLMEIMSKLK